MAGRKTESFFPGKVHAIKGRKEEMNPTVEGTPSLLSFIRSLFGWKFSSLEKLLLIKNTSQCKKLSPILEPASSWNDLPEDLLQQIVLKLDICQFIRAGAVCRSWDAVINLSEDTRRLMMQTSVNSQIPWLLQEHSPSTDLIHLYSLAEGKRYNFSKPKFMWESFCCGTSNGWLIMVDGSKFDPFMFLWNPLSAQIISLPPISTLPCYVKALKLPLFEDRCVANFVKRVEVFSVSVGNTEHVVVAAILGLVPFFGGKGQSLVLCTPSEDAEWTIIDNDKDRKWYYDMVHHNEILYVVEGILDNEQEERPYGRVEVHTISLANCEVGLALIQAKVYINRDIFEDYEEEFEEDRYLPEGEDISPCGEILGWLHLAKSTFGELLLITRSSAIFGYYEGEEVAENRYYVHNETRDFKVQVIKLEIDKSLYNLTGCTFLNNQALFVGSSGAVASASDLYQDCIWFLPSEAHVYESIQSNDSGVFYYQEKRIKRCFPSIQTPLPSNLGWFTPRLL